MAVLATGGAVFTNYPIEGADRAQSVSKISASELHPVVNVGKIAMSLFNWNEHKEFIIARLQEKMPLKFCLKTINDPEFTREWIEHHARIVGYRGLIIADNGSTDKLSLDLYEEYKDIITIFAFNGPHNEIHWHPRFSPLFSAINKSCNHFSFIDVDERLVWIEGDQYFVDERIALALTDHSAIYPTTWLINAPQSRDMFTLRDTEGRPRIENNLIWGKPIMPAALVGTSDGIHNIQYKSSNFSQFLAGRLFLLHFTQSPEQRISVNINKLASRGLISRQASVEEALQLIPDVSADSSVGRFLSEIKAMQILKSGIQESKTDPEFIRLLEDGSIVYSSNIALRDIRSFIERAPDLVKQKLSDGYHAN